MFRHSGRGLPRPYRIRVPRVGGKGMPPILPQRKSPRMQGYDYAQSGVYFVTLCTYGRAHLFVTFKTAR